MTAKRDLKRRVRQRQARTGESYVTARRRVLAARGEPTTGEDTQPDREAVKAREAIELDERDARPPRLPVVELHDVTREAWLLGYRCRVTMFPSVVEACEPASVLTALRDALVGGGSDPERARMFDVAFGIPSRPALAVLPEPIRAYAELTFPVTGRSGRVDIRCRLWPLAPSLMLRRADENEYGELAAPADVFVALRAGGAGTLASSRFAAELFRAAGTALFVIHQERRMRITGNTFTIGCDDQVADLVIRDSAIARTHAAVIRRNDAYYLKDLGSANGIVYKGMRIDSKRIEEGDVFHLHDHALVFTFRPG